MLKKILTKLWCICHKLPCRRSVFIHPLVKIIGSGQVNVEEGVELHSNVLLDTADKGVITISEGSNINSYTRVEAMNYVFIEPNVLIGPNVYISDRNHAYGDIRTPILKQGYFSQGGVHIGAGSWIGIHAAIIGNVTIGKHCVIGANCVVTQDLPDFSVTVGNPARIVKQYDTEKEIWERRTKGKEI